MDDVQRLTLPVEFWETTAAMKSMKPLKAPDPEGFQSLFFRKLWHIVGPSVHQLVSSAFQTSNFDDSLNQTLIVLIPKTDRPIQITEFRPISLCNVLYKIITKVLV